MSTDQPVARAGSALLGEADHLAGIGIETYGWRAQPLLRPSA